MVKIFLPSESVLSAYLQPFEASLGGLKEYISRQVPSGFKLKRAIFDFPVAFQVPIISFCGFELSLAQEVKLTNKHMATLILIAFISSFFVVAISGE